MTADPLEARVYRGVRDIQSTLITWQHDNMYNVFDNIQKLHSDTDNVYSKFPVLRTFRECGNLTIATEMSI